MMSFSQNTYIDPTVTAAMILYSENLKAKQNEVIDETLQIERCTSMGRNTDGSPMIFRTKYWKDWKKFQEPYKMEFR